MHRFGDDVHMKLVFEWNMVKNRQLLQERKVSFEAVVSAIRHGGLVDEVSHPNQRRYPGQRIYIVALQGYIYLVPFVTEPNGTRFLKTVIPSRRATRDYRRSKA